MAELTKKSSQKVRYGPDMRVLIIGAGVAGLTLMGLLRQRGFNPTLVERAPAFGDVGYVIVIWPSGSSILKGMGIYERLMGEGRKFTNYYVSNYKGEVINTYSIDPVAEKYGPIISIYRPELVDTLLDSIDPGFIKMNTTVDRIEQTPDEAIVEFDNGEIEKFDVVVGCDGVRSKTRYQIFGHKPLTYSGMAGWGFWVDPDLSKTDGIVEYWGKGRFIGIWPTKGRLSVFTSVRVPQNTPDPSENRIQRIRECYRDFGGVIPQILDQLGDPHQIYHDDYNDLQIDSWSKGRVVLVGDSAHAVLPNAGAGVSMALESASVLAEELCRADSKYVEHAFHKYEQRRKPRVNKIQNQSRMMGKVVYSSSKVLSTMRDYALKLYSKDILFKYWDNLLKDPI